MKLNQQQRDAEARRSDRHEASSHCAQSMEEGRASVADTLLHTTLDTAHCLTPTREFENIINHPCSVTCLVSIDRTLSLCSGLVQHHFKAYVG